MVALVPTADADNADDADDQCYCSACTADDTKVPVAQWIRRPPPERKIASSNLAGDSFFALLRGVVAQRVVLPYVDEPCWRLFILLKEWERFL